MAKKETKGDHQCSQCGQLFEDLELQPCTICRSLFCQYCAVTGYGRVFCSRVCRGFFFYGDGDATEEDF